MPIAIEDIKFQQYDQASATHQRAVVLASGWLQNVPAMSPFSPEDVANYPYALLAFSPQAVMLGHIAVVGLEEFEEDMPAEAVIGSLVVNPDERKQGVGGALLKRMIESVGGILPEVRNFRAYSDLSHIKFLQAAGGTWLDTRRPMERGMANYITSFSGAVRDAPKSRALSVR